MPHLTKPVFMTRSAIQSILFSLLVLLIPAAEISFASASASAVVSTQADDQVVVGTRIAPPFVIEDENGELDGITISLWEHIAAEMDIDYRYEIFDIAGMLAGVEDGSVYAGASALTITAEREEMVDFTHPFYVSGLGIATSYTPQGIWQAFMAVFDPEFLFVVGLLMLLLLFWGALVWYFERKGNEEEFGGSTAEGIGSGFWWAAVTMTTVGYGDKSPRTLGGRVVGFIWMFAAVIVISFFTASIASSLTVTQLDSKVSGPEDLPFVRVGILENSATEIYMNEENIRHRTYPTIEEGLRAVEEDRLDAFVHDAPIIRYETDQNFRNEVRVLGQTFNDQYYGIAIPLGAEYRNRMNQILLEYIASPEWREIQKRYGAD